MVAVFVFSVVMVLATGAIFSIVSANKTSQAIKSVMDNLNSALDSMSREIRYGTVYSCDSSPDFITPSSCPDSGDNTVFSFVARPTSIDPSGAEVIYMFKSDASLATGAIYKCYDDTSPDNCLRITAPEVYITNLHFYVKGAGRNEDTQPQLLITISGYAKAGTAMSPFNIETLVSQRTLDKCKNVVPDNTQPESCH